MVTIGEAPSDAWKFFLLRNESFPVSILSLSIRNFQELLSSVSHTDPWNVILEGDPICHPPDFCSLGPQLLVFHVPEISPPKLTPISVQSRPLLSCSRPPLRLLSKAIPLNSNLSTQDQALHFI